MSYAPHLMPNADSCSLWIVVARTDVAFMMQTIPHLVRMCNYPFLEKVLAIDTMPLSGEKTHRPHKGAIEQLRSCCEKLKSMKVVDRIVDIDYSTKYREKAYKKNLGTSRIKKTHNYKGYPILGSIFCIEEAKGDYFLHFDSDIFLYQKEGFDWIDEGINILKKYPEAMWIRPSAGPQSETNNTGGFQRRKGFASRCYLIKRSRFEKLLPLKVIWARRQGRKKDKLPRKLIEILNYFTGGGILDSWEKMVAESVNRKSFIRVDISPQKAWTLHPNTRSDKFINNLPLIIEKVEKGWAPPEQVGNYDLKLDYWIK